MRAKSERLSLWDLAVLAFLHEEPMHPYEMQRLLRERHKDELLSLKRGSLYHAIRRLAGQELIEALSTGRAGRRPERTTYRITTAGAAELARALRHMIAVPSPEPSEFMGSLSFLPHLTTAEAAAELERRALRLETAIEATAAGLTAAARYVERVNLIESEYLLAMHRAELAWVRGAAAEIRRGQLAWDLRQMLKHVRAARRQAGHERSGTR